jgi:3-phenylpropionate/trans-cinnamate dioxygenase ferredoxin subunit
MSEIKVAQLSEIEKGRSKTVSAEGQEILICHSTEGVFAIRNQCPHQLQPLSGGRIRGGFIFCPLHGQRFGLADGAPYGRLTDKPVDTFPVRLDGDDIYVTVA